MHRDARGWMHGGELPLWPFQRAQRGRRCLFITVSLVISWFIKIDLKQIYCSYLDTQKIQNDFLQFLLLFLRSTLLIKETNIICNVFFLFLKSFHCPQLHYCSPCPTAAPASLNMHVVSTNFAKTLVWNRECEVILWCHKQRKSSNKTTMCHCSIEPRRGESNQAVAPGITRLCAPLA